MDYSWGNIDDIKAFQRSNGLIADGIVGKNTAKAMNSFNGSKSLGNLYNHGLAAYNANNLASNTKADSLRQQTLSQSKQTPNWMDTVQTPSVASTIEAGGLGNYGYIQPSDGSAAIGLDKDAYSLALSGGTPGLTGPSNPNGMFSTGGTFETGNGKFLGMDKDMATGLAGLTGTVTGLADLTNQLGLWSTKEQKQSRQLNDQEIAKNNLLIKQHQDFRNGLVSSGLTPKPV